MSELKKIAVWLAVNTAFATCVWLGFVEGVDGFRNVALFWVWAIALPCAFVALMPSAAREFANQPARPVRRVTGNLVSVACLLVMVWNGYVLTALAWGFYLMTLNACLARADEIRAERRA